MSFLNSVLSSIETGDVPPPPPPVQRPASPNSASSSVTTSTPGTTRQNGQSGLKRKAESQLPSTDRLKKTRQPSTSQKSTPVPSAKPSTPTRPSPAKPVESKPPPKGSYADIIAQAQALQNKAPVKLGLITHKSAQKERLSKSQVAKEAKQQEGKKGAKSTRALASGARGAAGKLGDAKQRETPAEPEYKGTARPTPPKEPVYKGTAGRPPKVATGKSRSKPHAHRPRRDEYLATDEEDEGDFYYEQDDYYSDGSDDMEAGFDDVFQEEEAAKRIAQKEDERELRLEAALKKQKLERKNKLAQLSRARR